MMSTFRILLLSDNSQLFERINTKLASEINVFSHLRLEETKFLFLGSDLPYEMVILDDSKIVDRGFAIQGTALVERLYDKKASVTILPLVGQDYAKGIDYLKKNCRAYLSIPLDQREVFLTELDLRIRHAYQRYRAQVRFTENLPIERLLNYQLSLDNTRDLKGLLKDFLKSIRALGFTVIRLYLITKSRDAMIGIASLGINDQQFVGSEFSYLEDEYTRRLDLISKATVYKNDAKRSSSFNANEWGCVPLFSGHDLIGMVIVERKENGEDLVESDLKPISRLGEHVAPDLIKARDLFLAEIRAGKLSALVQKEIPLLSELHSTTFLMDACKTAVEVIGTDHACIAWIQLSRSRATVVAEFPKMKMLGESLLINRLFKKVLLEMQKEILVPSVNAEDHLGDNKVKILSYGIQSFLLIPITWGGKVVAVIMFNHTRPNISFSDVEMRLVKGFSQNLSIVMENHRLYHAAKEKTEQLHLLRKISLSVTMPMTRKKLFEHLVKYAVELLGSKSGGLHQLVPHASIPGQERLEVVAKYHSSDRVKKYIEIGEGLCGKLIESGDSYKIIDNYNDWPERVYPRKYPAMLGVPLQWEEEVLGVIYVDDELGRKYTQDDAWLLRLFADHASSAIINERQISRIKEQNSRMEEQKLYLDSVLDSSNDCIIALDTKGQIVRFNKKAYEILGYSEAEAKEVTIWRIYENDAEPKLIGEMLEETGVVSDYITNLRKKDGTQLTISLTLSWIVNDNKVRIGSLGVFRDYAEHTARVSFESLEQIRKFSPEIKELQPILKDVAPMAAMVCDADWCEMIVLDGKDYLPVEQIAFQRKATFEYQLSKAMVDLCGRYLAKWSTVDRGFALSNQKEDDVEALAAIQCAQAFPAEKPLEAALVLPVVYRNHRLGVILLGRNGGRKGVFSKCHLSTGQAVAEKVASLVDLYLGQRHKNRRSRLMDQLFETVDQINVSEGFPFQDALLAAVKLLGYQSGLWLVIRAPIQRYEVRAATPEMNASVGAQIGFEGGLLQRVAESGRGEFVMPGEDETLYDWLPDAFFNQALLVVRLKSKVGANHLLILGRDSGLRTSSKADLDVLERLALHLVGKMDNAKMMEPLNCLNQIGVYIQEKDHLDEVLFAVLTGVTHGLGLGFNRAIVFSYERRKRAFQALGGIGQKTQEEAVAAWRKDWESGAMNLEKLLADQGNHPFQNTVLGQACQALTIPCKDAGLFSVLLKKAELITGSKSNIKQLPSALVDLLHPKAEFVLVPLPGPDGVIGLLYADHAFTRDEIGENAKTYLTSFARYAAIAISRDELKRKKDRYLHMLESAIAAGHEMVTPHQSDRVLLDAAQKLKQMSGAHGVCLLVQDQQGKLRVLLAEGVVPRGLSTNDRVGDQISWNAFRQAHRVIKTDLQRYQGSNPMLRMKGLDTACCLPIQQEGGSIGVLWFWFGEPVKVGERGLETCQLLLNQAGVVHGNVKRLKELTILGTYAEAFAGTLDLSKLRQLIVDGIRELMGADQVLLLHHDQAGMRFLPKHHAGVGIGAEQLTELVNREPLTSKGIGKHCSKIWNPLGLAGRSLSDEALPYLKECLDLQEQDQLLVLRLVTQSQEKEAAQWCNAYLYVVFKQRIHLFSPHEKRVVLTFCRQAAVAYGKTLLIFQDKKVKETLRAVNNFNALEIDDAVKHTWEVQRILDHVATQTKEYTACDSVVVYEFNQDTNDIGRTATADVHLGAIETTLEKSSVLDRVAEHAKKNGQVIVVEDVENDKTGIFEGSKFTKKIGVKSCLILSLSCQRKRVGWMFVNFYSYHRFGSDEIENIALFAYSVSETLVDAQLYEEGHQREMVSKRLNEAGKCIAQKFTKNNILKELAIQAWSVNDFNEKDEACVDVLLVQDGILVSAATSPSNIQSTIAHCDGENYDVVKGIKGKKGVTGRALHTQESQVQGDVRQVEDYIPVHPWARSKMVVPIIKKEKVVALLSHEHGQVNYFRRWHVEAMETLSHHVIAALENVDHVEKAMQDQVFAGNVSGIDFMQLFQKNFIHDLASDISGMNASLTQIQNSIPPGVTETEDSIESLRDSLGRLKHLPSPEPLDLEKSGAILNVNTLLAEQINKIQTVRRYGGIEFEIKLLTGRAASSRVKVSPYWFYHILKILVNNARHAFDKSNTINPKMTWVLKTTDSEVQLSVSDNGPGIPAEISQKLFTGPLNKSDGAQGSGIGLHIAATLCKVFKGSITLDKECQHGACFTITFPKSKSKVSNLGGGGVTHLPNMERGKSRKIIMEEIEMKDYYGRLVLLVDNNLRFLRAIENLLTSYGIQVITADTPREAMKIIQEQDVDLAIIDNRLCDDNDHEDYSGFALALSAEARRIQKILWSGFDLDPQSLAEWYGQELTLSDFNLKILRKDISTELLIDIVTKKLEVSYGYA